MQLSADPRRADRERRYKPPPPTSAPAEDLTTDYMNILGNLLIVLLFNSDPSATVVLGKGYLGHSQGICSAERMF